MRNLSAFIVGSIFSLGLVVSGMTDTEKVRGFLDVLGEWDPTLLFVMGGAMIPMLIAWKIAQRFPLSALNDDIQLTTRSTVDKQLLIGSVLFGVGWGLVGFCPGPNIASLSYGGFSSLLFFVSMVAAMGLYSFVKREAG